MYQNIYIETDGEYNSTVHLWDDEMGYMQLPFSEFDYAFKPDHKGSYTSMTGEKVSKTKFYSRKRTDYYEIDIPKETRVLTDLYLDDDSLSKNVTVLYFDIETTQEHGFPNPKNPLNEITAITLYDSESCIYNVLVLDRDGVKSETSKENVNTFFFKNEVSLLHRFVELYEKISPKIITGWNSNNFDVPYLYNRVSKICGVGVANRLSPIKKVRYSKYKDALVIAGVSCLDYLQVYKKFTYSELPNYRLDTVGREEVGMGKIEYSGSLDELFNNDIDKFIEYNIRDVEIIVALDKKKKLIEIVRGICHVGHVPYEDYNLTSRFLEGTILTYLHRKGIVATNKPEGGQERMQSMQDGTTEKFTGAYVKIPVPGLYKWVYSLDLQSLYPSIIMTLNISKETKFAKVVNFSAEKFASGKINTYIVRMESNGSVEELTDDQFRQFIKKNNLSLASNGVMYRKPVIRNSGESGVKKTGVGIIPEILDNWFSQRKEYNNLKNKNIAEGNKELADFYDMRQHIQKIFLNSLYGYLGLPISRFYDVDNAEAVTLTGQTIIVSSEAFVNKLYNSKLSTDGVDYCTYIDTDSLYFSAMPLLPEGADECEFAIKLARMVERLLNSYYDDLSANTFFSDTHRLYIKGENIASRAFWTTRKKYGMKIAYDLEKNIPVFPPKDIKIKGLDSIRSSFPKAFQSLMGNVLNNILGDRPKRDSDELINSLVSNLKSMDPLDVSRNTSVKEISKYTFAENTLNKYRKRTPINVKAALTYNHMLKHFGIENEYDNIRDGDKIKYAYLKENPLNASILAFKGDGDPPEILDYIKTYIDYKKLFERELKKKIQVFYTAMGWGLIPTDMNQKVHDFFIFN
jgi:DNA polymerase elongation subunit (family B)